MLTYETLVIMKKKQFTSKLQFQKTTIISFNSMKNIVGGALQHSDTVPISNNTLVCLTFSGCHTQNNEQTCLSCADTECTRPTGTVGGITDFCNDTKADCLDTRRC